MKYLIRGRILLPIAVLLVNALAVRAATITWTNTQSGGWNTAANWSPNNVPGGSDTAIIPVTGVTVSLQGGTSVSNVTLGGSAGTTALSLGGQTLTLNGTFTVNSGGSFVIANGALAGSSQAALSGQVGWSGGAIAGALTVASNGALTISSGNDDMSGAVLTNNGTVIWASGTIRCGNGSQIYNYGLWDAQSDQTINNAFGGAGSAFNNFGNFRK